MSADAALRSSATNDRPFVSRKIKNSSGGNEAADAHGKASMFNTCLVIMYTLHLCGYKNLPLCTKSGNLFATQDT